MVGELSFIFEQRLQDQRTENTNGVRVDKDLFKAGAILDIFLCVSSFYFIINKLENLIIGQYFEVEETITF